MKKKPGDSAVGQEKQAQHANKRAPLTPAQRILRAQMGAHALHATHDPQETTRAAIHASQVTRFEKLVDPDHELPEAERERRVRHARAAYMRGLALKRSRAASAQKARAPAAVEE